MLVGLNAPFRRPPPVTKCRALSMSSETSPKEQELRLLLDLPLRRLDPQLPLRQIRGMLLDAGLLAPQLPPVDDEDPRGWISAVQELLGELEHIEAELPTLSISEGWQRDAPPWMIAVAVTLPPIAVALALVSGSPYALMYVLGGGGLVAAVVLTWFVLHRIQRSRSRVRRLTSLRQQDQILRMELCEGARAVLNRSFIARAPSGLVGSLPLMRWLDTHGLDRPELVALHQRLRQVVGNHRRSPPVDWTDRGLLPEEGRALLEDGA